MPELPTCILIDPAVTSLDEIGVDPDGHSLTLHMSVTSPDALCPRCAQSTSRVHSHYHRTLADLPWAHLPVHIDLSVRRFFCPQPDCPQRIFTERLPTVAKPWARRTQRLGEVQQQLGIVAGGSAGSALATTLACPAGVDLLITLVRQRSIPEHPTPRVLGVDDWAMRKGQRYGTILIDHERGDIVDLLPDRTPERLAQWLRDHPGVEIVTRDRAEAYAQGITEGAPDAIQVADRWHLIKNVSDAIASVFQDHRQAITSHLRPAAHAATPQEGEVTTALEPSCLAGNAPPQADRPTAAPTPADLRRQAQAQEAHDFHALGWLQKEIAQKLNCHPRTVRRYLRQALPLPPRDGDRGSKLDGYKPYILRRWNEGCHNASQLLREIQAQGFDGRCSIMRAYVASLRELSGVPPRSRRGAGQPLTTPATERVPSSRMLAWMSTQEPHVLDDDQRTTLEKLSAVNLTTKTALELGQEFATMVRHRQAEKLDEWLERAAQSGIASFVSIAKGMRADEAAVRAGLTLEWSNGRTEGCVNRLKCVKRQMYGRGKLDLLRSRLLAA